LVWQQLEQYMISVTSVVKYFNTRVFRYYLNTMAEISIFKQYLNTSVVSVLYLVFVSFQILPQLTF